MAEITKELGRVPISRGEFNLATTYYKDNIVQYQYASYQVTAESVTGVAPVSPEGIVNTGWIIFGGSVETDKINKVLDHGVLTDNWDEQDDDPEDYDPLAVTESSYAYNWKTTDTPASNGNTEGNLKELYQSTIDLNEKVTELKTEVKDTEKDIEGTKIQNEYNINPNVSTHNFLHCNFVAGETYTIANGDGGYLRQIYLADADNNAINNGFKINGAIQGVINTIANTSSITFECMVSAPKIHIYQRDTDAEATFVISGGSDGLNTRVETIESKIEGLVEKRVIKIGSTRNYTSILKAMRDNGANCIYKLDGETFDLRAEYIQEYGNTFFSAYSVNDYNSVDNFKKGLFLGIGCEVIGMSGTKIVFNNVDGNSASKTFFAPFNLSTDNRLESVEINISDAGCRYHIHDDFANLLKSRGKNEIRNCVFVGTPKETGCIGGGMYWGCTYIVESCRFMSGKTYSMYYHNNANKLYEGTKNRLIIKDCYCETSLPIVVMYCGVSTEITDAYIYNNRANIQKIPHTDSSVPTSIDNVALFEWNNISV